MAEKKIVANLKLKLKAGQANAGPPVGSTLGQYGVNIMDFVGPFNDQTKELNGQDVTVHIAIYEDHTMKFRVVGAPTDTLILSKLGITKGSGRPNSEKITQKLSQNDLNDIAKLKAIDMNTSDIEAVKKMIAGTARSMGVEIEL